MFVDQVKLKLFAGKGGNGVVAWRREKYIPKGGPSGGNGGKGASIYFKASHQVYSLEDFRNTTCIQAEKGAQGGASLRQGKSGEDLYLPIPIGSIVREAHSKTLLFDFTEEGQEYLICTGGRGGKGNAFFKNSRRRAPNFCTEGTEGDSIEVEIELKLIADIGFVGMPNAGKSTLLSKLTHIPVKIAPYPFTTLIPNLGFYQKGEEKVLLADIPGIIEGAHQNRGLGLSFLKHIERTSALVFVIDTSARERKSPLEDFETLKKEIEHYSPEVLKKPFLIVLNKMDLPESEEWKDLFLKSYPDLLIYPISAEKEEGLESLGDKILSLKDKKKEEKSTDFSLLLKTLSL